MGFSQTIHPHQQFQVDSPVQVEDHLLDLREILVESFNIDDGAITFKEPLVLARILAESCQVIMLQDERLGINVAAKTRKELKKELYATLKMLWKQSQLPDEKLDKASQEQKKNLLAAVEEF
jgi:hypothetical protein